MITTKSSSLFRSAAFAAVIGASALAATAQAAPLPKDECRLANSVVGELFKKYNGKLSAQFVASIKQFVARDCDMDTDFKMVEGTQDKTAFGELRVRLIAYRTAGAKPVSYSR